MCPLLVVSHLLCPLLVVLRQVHTDRLIVLHHGDGRLVDLLLLRMSGGVEEPLGLQILDDAGDDRVPGLGAQLPHHVRRDLEGGVRVLGQVQAGQLLQLLTVGGVGFITHTHTHTLVRLHIDWHID